MAEPQPSDVHEGMDNEDGPPPPPASAEDRKAAAAMSSLESRGNDEEAEAKLKLNKSIDQDALGAAISRLELADKGSKVGVVESEKKAREKEEVAKRAKVKVDQADVGLLVGQWQKLRFLTRACLNNPSSLRRWTNWT